MTLSPYPSHTSQTPLISQVLELRLLVGFLGERAQYGWWPTAFYGASNQPFLRPVFARTSRLVQYHGTVEAARRLHDEHLSGGSLHLFRLPEEWEQDLHQAMQNAAATQPAVQILSERDQALRALERISAAKQVTEDGPLAMGHADALQSWDTFQGIAAAYASAFKRGTKCFPYLMK